MSPADPPKNCTLILKFLAAFSRRVLDVRRAVSFIDVFPFFIKNGTYLILPYYSEFYENMLRTRFYPITSNFYDVLSTKTKVVPLIFFSKLMIY